MKYRIHRKKTNKKKSFNRSNKSFYNRISKKLIGGSKILVNNTKLYEKLPDNIKSKLDEIELLLYSHQNEFPNINENNSTYKKKYPFDMVNISYFTKKVNDIIGKYHYNPDKNTDNSELLISKLNQIKLSISQSNEDFSRIQNKTQYTNNYTNNYWNFT